MICLGCREKIKGNPPLKCSGCGHTHQARPPVVGINHVSQLLSALDSLAVEEIPLEDFEVIFDTFVEKMETLQRKWALDQSFLSPRLSGALQERFTKQFAELDEALQLGYQGVELVEAVLAGEIEHFDAAEECLVGFFRGVCAASASLLDQLDVLKQNDLGGQLYNLPSV